MAKNPKRKSDFPRWLFAQECNFIAGAATIDALPATRLPEIAFVGRSNVGKSSLINALTGRKSLARISHTPGRTQQINFFNLGDQLMLVDLPGYGFAKVSKQQQQQWGDLIGHYLATQPNLRLLCLLIDGRHGIKPSDKDMMTLLKQTATPFLVVLTKADKTKKTELEKVKTDVEEFLKTTPGALNHLIITSAHEKYGADDLRDYVSSFATGSPK